MIAAPAIIVSESYHPFYPLTGAAVTHFDQMEAFIPFFWVIPTLWSAIFELYSIAAGWEPGARGLSTVRGPSSSTYRFIFSHAYVSN